MPWWPLTAVTDCRPMTATDAVEKEPEVLYVKLGRRGDWEATCLEEGTVRLGFREVPHDLCMSGDWRAVRQHSIDLGEAAGTATARTTQLRCFYEATERTVFITFHGGRMYWCRTGGAPEPMEDGGRLRRTLNGWSSQDHGGQELDINRLSGSLTRVRGFRGTLCTVAESAYALRRIGGGAPAEVEEAREMQDSYRKSLLRAIRLLTPQDFELLVELLFTTTGWRRTGLLGGTQKTIDISLELPTTGQKAFVQVKSTADRSVLRVYESSPELLDHRMFFVWHSGSLDENCDDVADGVTLMGPTRLSELVVDAGLGSWVLDRVS